MTLHYDEFRGISSENLAAEMTYNHRAAAVSFPPEYGSEAAVDGGDNLSSRWNFR